MRRVALLSLMFAVMLMAGGCVVRQTIDTTFMPTTDAVVDSEAVYPVSLSVIDNRPYVLSGDKETCFIGKYRATFGNLWDVRTEGNVPLADVLRRDLAADLQRAGFTLTDGNAERQIAVLIQDYNFDCYLNCRVWHVLQVAIKDASGDILYSKDITSEEDVAGSVMWGPKSAMEKQMPVIYAKMIQGIIRNDPAAIDALKRPPDDSGTGK